MWQLGLFISLVNADHSIKLEAQILQPQQHAKESTEGRLWTQTDTVCQRLTSGDNLCRSMTKILTKRPSHYSL